jgi:hypothetical protein
LFLRETPISKKYTKEEIRSMVNLGGDVYFINSNDYRYL